MMLVLFFIISIANGCFGYETLSSIACENTTLNIQCPPNHILNILDANFGRVMQEICPDPNNNLTVNFKYNCKSNDSTSIVSRECNEKNNCSILASKSIFHDACPNTTKYLEVDYNCIKVRSCPPNEYFTIYSPRCPRTCAPVRRLLIPCGFKIGCRCTIGYIRDHQTGLCVDPRFCPFYDEYYPSRTTFEEIDTCGSACPDTCQNWPNNSTVCTENCVPGYFCSFGFIRDTTTNRCIRPEDCPFPTN